MSDKPFRILLDLTDLHINGFKYVWINISPRDLKTISDLKADLFKRLNFEKQEIKLFVRDGLLLDEETIIVLREDDTVKVQYEDHSLSLQNGTSSSVEGKVQRSFHKRSFIECSTEDFSPKAKKQKNSHNSVSSMNEDSNIENTHKKKKKSKKSCDSPQNVFEDTVTIINKCGENLTSDSIETQVTERKKKNSLKSSDVCIADEAQKSNEAVFETASESMKTNTSELSQNASQENSHKKKRKRNKKRKNASNLVGSYVPVNNMSVTDVQYSIPSFAPDTSAIRKHIVFTSPTPCHPKNLDVISKDIQTRECSSKMNEAVVSSENSLSLKEDSQNVSNKSNSYPKISTPTLSSGYQRKWVSPMMEVDVLNSPQSNMKPRTEKSVEKNSFSDVANEKNLVDTSESKYSNLPSIKTLPAVGSLIAFKMLELDEHYNPAVSNYKEGIVKSIDPTTEDIEIDLIEIEIKPGRIGKFENLKEGEEPDPEIIQTVTLQLNKLIEPKQVK